MGQRVVTRDLPRLSFRASFDLATVDVDKRTVQVIWTTGARVLRGFWESFYEELSLDPKHVRMGRLQSGTAPLLNSHRSYDLEDVIGVIEDAQLDAKAKRGTATVRFDSGAKGEEVFRKVREGILRNTSVGYSTYKMLKIEDGDSTIPVYRAVDWEPAEISMVAIGADSGAVTRTAGGNPCEFIQERAMPDPEETETDTDETAEECECEGEEDCDCEESADEEREADTESEPEPKPEPKRSAADLERFRILGIQRVGRALKRPADEINAAISKGMTLAKYRARAQDAYAKKETIVVDKRDARIQVGADARDKFMRCAEHLIYQRAGIADMMVAHAKSRGETLVIDPGECRGLTMAELAREFLERGGTKTRGMDKMELVGKAFMQRTGGMNSTGDFPVLLENTLHKTLLAAYNTTPDTWRRFCKTGTVSDFRPHPRYRQGSFGVLETVNEGGEFRNASIPDGEKQSITAGTKGRIVALTRQAIINDDMGAFNDIATRLGRAAALTIEVDVYALLAANPTMGDGVALFHADHGNIGTGAAISVASIDADRVLMAQQQDVAENEYLELRPAVLVLPVGLGGQARVINQAQFDTDKIANARNQEPNKVVGLYRDIVDTARLSGTTRYSFADPGIAPVIEVVFLNGQQSPYMEMQQGWRSDGTEWKIRLDFGVGAIDWRGTVRNAGA